MDFRPSPACSFVLPPGIRYSTSSPALISFLKSKLDSQRSGEREERPGKLSMPKNNVLARAGRGRLSGAIHGNKLRKGRNRRRPTKQEDDGSGVEMESGTEKELRDDVTRMNSCADILHDDKFEVENENMTLDVHLYDTANGKASSTDQHLFQSTLNPNGKKFQQKPLKDGEKGEAGRKYDWVDSASRERGAGNGDMHDERPWKAGMEKAKDQKVTNGKSLGKSSSNNGVSKSSGKDVSIFVEETEPIPATIVTDPELSGQLQVQKIQKQKDLDCNLRKKGIGLSDAQSSNESTMKHLVVETGKQIQAKRKNRMVGTREITEVRLTQDAERPDDVLGSLESVSLNNEGTQALGNAERTVRSLEGSSSKAGPSIAEALELQGQERASLLDQVQQSGNMDKENHEKLSLVPMQGGTAAGGSLQVSLEAPLEVLVNSSGQPSQLGNQVVEHMSESPPDSSVKQDSQVFDIPHKVVEQVGQIVVDQATEIGLDSIKKQVVQVVDQVEKFPSKVVGQVSQVAEQVVQIGQKVVDQVAETLPDPVVEHVGQVAEQVSQAAEQIVEQVAGQVVEPVTVTAAQVTEKVSNFLAADEGSDDSEDEFEAYRTSDLPEFKGIHGLQNFTVQQEEEGILSAIHDFYIYMLKKPLPEFALGMLAAPILLSMIFTLLYLPEFQGLAIDERVREFFESSGADVDVTSSGLHLSWYTVFEVFMFSVSLSTGLQPTLAPLSPYTLVVANVNALIAQLIFVFLSGAVFARLSQPSQPIRCSRVALVCPPARNRRHRPEVCYKVLMARYVLAGPQPCELVDVKVDLTFKHNTVTRSGTFFRATQSLKLVRPEMAYLNHGMLLRHVIDETSPLYNRTLEMLKKEDAIISLSVVGLERASMQSIFHVHHYCVYDGDLIWNAEFEDMILISKKNRRIVDHSLLSKWKPVDP